jgi:ABC-type branched-subunit amino acid transport system ATPase component
MSSSGRPGPPQDESRPQGKTRSQAEHRPHDEFPAQDTSSPKAATAAERGLVVSELSKTFAGVQALSGVSLEVPPAGVVGLIGPNGSGKTTLLNCISGILTPDSGAVTVRGVQVTGRPEYVCSAKGIARTFQNLRLFTSLSVADNLLIGGHLGGSMWHPLRRARHRGQLAAELMDLLELTALARAIAGSLSYGVQRRVEIARALMGSPAVLLLDEPAAGMNEAEAGRIVTVLRELAKRGLAVLLVEHNMTVVTSVSNTVFALDAGVELAKGEPADVMVDPGVVRAYLG